MSNTTLDLSQLALDRSPRAGRPAGQRRWWSRYVLPIGILCGFAALLGTAAGRRWLPQQSVTVIPVTMVRAAAQSAGTVLFQAPGWIEPRPTAIRVAALAPGVIEELLVVEGQYVKKHEPVARLIAIDAELQVEQAKIAWTIREGELSGAQAEYDAAKLRLENPVHLQVQLADSQSAIAKVHTEVANLPYLIESAEANLKFALSDLQGKQSAQGAVSGRIVERSASEYAVAQARLEELQNRQPFLQRESDALQGKVEVLQKQLELLVDEHRQLRAAEIEIQAAIALRDEAKLQLRQAELTLDRNTIRAPMDGRVLRLVAMPGSHVMGMDTTNRLDGGAVIEMYDPQRLQVRADVRLEDVPMVTRGQPVEIVTASSAGVISGRVLQLTSSANSQKNTLEVKIELINPPPTVSPEMLVTTTFLVPPILENSPAGAATTESERMFVPRQLVLADEAGEFVWIVDANELAAQARVEIGNPGDRGLVEIKRGLNVTDKLIASGAGDLRPGSRVKVTGDDPTLGIESSK